MKRPNRLQENNVSLRALNRSVNDVIDALDYLKIAPSPGIKPQPTSSGTILTPYVKIPPADLVVKRLRVFNVAKDYLECGDVAADGSLITPPPLYIVAKQLNCRGSGAGYHGMTVTMDGSWNGRTIDTGFSYPLRNAQIIQSLEPSYGLDEIFALFGVTTGLSDASGTAIEAIEISPARTWQTSFQSVSFTGTDGKQKQLLVQGSTIISTPP